MRYIVIESGIWLNPERVKTFQEISEEYGGFSGLLESSSFSETDKATLLEMGKSFENLLTSIDAGLISAIQNSEYLDTASVRAHVDMESGFQRQTLQSLEEQIAERAKQTRLKAEKTVSRSRLIVLISGIVALVLSVSVALVLPRTIALPVRKVADMLSSMARGAGDLTAAINVRTRDEIGEMAGYFNDFLGTLRQIIIRIKESASESRTIGESLSDSTTQSSSVVSEIAANVDSIRTRLTRQDGDITASAENTQRILGGSDRLAAQIEHQSAAVNESSSSVEQMIASIKNVARIAGDAGRGFSVVAQEIRKLAEMTATNAKGISTFLKANIKQIESVQTVSAESGASFLEIRGEVEQTVGALTEISTAMTEMSAGSGEILKAVGTLNDVTEGIRQAFAEMQVQAKGINAAMGVVRSMSAESLVGISEIALGTDAINGAMVRIAELSRENKTKIDGITGQIQQFKT